SCIDMITVCAYRFCQSLPRVLAMFRVFEKVELKSQCVDGGGIAADIPGGCDVCCIEGVTYFVAPGCCGDHSPAEITGKNGRKNIGYHIGYHTIRCLFGGYIGQPRG